MPTYDLCNSTAVSGSNRVSSASSHHRPLTKHPTDDFYRQFFCFLLCSNCEVFTCVLEISSGSSNSYICMTLVTSVSEHEPPE